MKLDSKLDRATKWIRYSIKGLILAKQFCERNNLDYDEIFEKVSWGLIIDEKEKENGHS